MRRRWVLRGRSATGEEVWVILSVPAGTCGEIRATVAGTTLVYTPEELARVRRVLLDVIAAALQARGTW